MTLGKGDVASAAGRALANRKEVSNARSADRVLSVLVYLAGRAKPAPAMMIAQACDVPKSSAYHLLAVMRKRNFVTYYPEDRTWGLGVAAFEIGSAYLRSEPLERLGTPALRGLSSEVNEVCHLAILHGGDVMYLSRERPPNSWPHLAFGVGVRVPAHLTAVGRAMLMHLTLPQLRAMIPPTRPLTGRLGRGTYLRSQLEQELAEARRRGYASEDGLITPGVGCIAAPVFSYEGYPMAAVGVTFDSNQRNRRRRAALGEAVMDTARQLSGALAWREAEEAQTPDADGTAA